MQVGLADAGNRRAGGYSLGMRQRLALATALLGDPAVLVLDEPANGLDPEGIQWLRGFLRHLAHEQGRTVLVSSHLLSEVEQTVDRVVIVGAGRLVREGSMEQLRSGRRRRRHGPRPQPRGRPARRGAARPAAAPCAAGRRRASPSPGPRPPRSAARPSPPGSSCTSCARRPAASRRSTSSSPAAQEQFAAPPAGTHRRPGGHPMIRLVRAEWTKLFTTKVWLGLLLGSCVLVAGFAALLTGFAGNPESGIPPVGDAAVRAAGTRPGHQRQRALPDPRHHRDDAGVPAPHGDADVPRPRRGAGHVVVAKLIAYALVAVPFALVVLAVNVARRRRLRRRPGRGAVADRRQRRGARDLGPGAGHLRGDRRRDRGAGAQPGRRDRRRAGVPVRHRAGDPLDPGHVGCLQVDARRRAGGA